jgi:lipopolysaccharide transport system ATP-binding protein
MARPIIEVEGISKRYSIGKKQSYGSLREEIMQAIASPFKRSGRASRKSDSIWVLKDIGFELQEGEVLGIIGRNGAGKSTLLKILSRITEPTKGRIKMRGRVASLLEVGTGFHPELTGRENIFLNGALLGMGNVEIRSKFDEIVAFSEIEKFLDTPVKRYSSGMYVRLAFAVAAHLEPEILIIDEVLAVGDSAFQEKCLGKVGDMAGGGRTVLFVSHNMAAVSKLCTRGLYLDDGVIAGSGAVDDVIGKYASSATPELGGGPVQITDNLSHRGSVDFTIDAIKVTRADGVEITRLNTGDSIKIRVEYTANERLGSPNLFIICKTGMDAKIFQLSNGPISGYNIDEVYGKGFFELLINDIPLVGGTYFLDVGFARGTIERYFIIDKAVKLIVSPTDVYGSGLELDNSRGLVAVSHKWNHSTINS